MGSQGQTGKMSKLACLPWVCDCSSQAKAKVCDGLSLHGTPACTELSQFTPRPKAAGLWRLIRKLLVPLVSVTQRRCRRLPMSPGCTSCPGLPVTCPADVLDASGKERVVLHPPGFFLRACLSDIGCLALIAGPDSQILFRDQTSSFKPNANILDNQTLPCKPMLSSQPS